MGNQPPLNRTRKHLAIDYDGTIVDIGWPGHGKPKPNAAAVIKRLLQQYDVTIFSTRIAPVDVDGVTRRSGVEIAKEVRGIDRKLKQMGLPYIPIWQDPWKVGADLYIDDKGVHYDGNWLATEFEIERRLNGN